MKVSNHFLAASAVPLPTRREDLLARLTEPQVWDLLVVGGGATGLGVAWQAAREGLKVALLEARDFAQGTSSRSTKLVHGGVRYLAQGHWPLVREVLHERRGLLERAPIWPSPWPLSCPLIAGVNRRFMVRDSNCMSAWPLRPVWAKPAF